MDKIKGWITWPDQYEQSWCHCSLILENGWPIYGHLCSHPGYALGDLWRSERKNDWEKAGLELEIVAQCPYSELPAHVTENNKTDGYVEFANKFFPQYLKEPQQPSVEAVIE
jgi:hypothetical protein